MSSIAHPAANAFPMLDGDAYAALRDDIALHGVHVPIVKTPDGLILDGRNRAAACAELGLPCPSIVYDGDPVAYVVSLNLLRRHLNESQRALAAARLATMERGRPKSESGINRPIGLFIPEVETAPDLPRISQPEAAEMMGASERSVRRAAAVLKGVADGVVSPDLAVAIERGDVSVNKAYEEVQAMRRGEEEPALIVAPPVVDVVSLADHQRINLSTSNEWYTPAQFVEAARQVMGGIDLDPASCAFANQVVQATRYYTQDDDGMAQRWYGRVWMNPPYGREEGERDSNQARWTRRLLEAYQAGDVTEAIMLVNAVPGNRWFVPLKAYPICFPDARIRFYNEETEAGQPTHSNALIYLGPHLARFRRVFSVFGAVMGTADVWRNYTEDNDECL